MTPSVTDSTSTPSSHGDNHAGDGVRALDCLTRAVGELTQQKTLEHSFHEMLYALRDATHPTACAVLLKDAASDHLVIRAQWNLSENFSQQFRRGIGTGLIGRLMYRDGTVEVTADSPTADYGELRMQHDYEWATAARIALSGRPLGYLVGWWEKAPGNAPLCRELVGVLAQAAAVAVQLDEEARLIRRLQLTDPETGLLLYPCFRERLEEELKRCRRYGEPLTVAFLDIDNYRATVNTYGIATGRALYAAVVEFLKAGLRESDVLCSFGADEILAYFPSTDTAGVRTILERWTGKIREQRFTEHALATSLSIGLARFASDDDSVRLVWRAQKALHQARVSGQAVLAEE